MAQPFDREGFTVCFTGHRPASLPFGGREDDPRCILLKKKLREAILYMIEHRGACNFISGMAIGVDTYAAEIVLELKKDYPHLHLHCAIPCKAQDAKWQEADKRRYRDLVPRADSFFVLYPAYTPSCMQERNRYMVDRSQAVIAVWNGKPSGTGSTVRYAEKLGKEVLKITP